jgi:hypothetical protein
LKAHEVVQRSFKNALVVSVRATTLTVFIRRRPTFSVVATLTECAFPSRSAPPPPSASANSASISFQCRVMTCFQPGGCEILFARFGEENNIAGQRHMDRFSSSSIRPAVTLSLAATPESAASSRLPL